MQNLDGIRKIFKILGKKSNYFKPSLNNKIKLSLKFFFLGWEKVIIVLKLTIFWIIHICGKKYLVLYI